MENIQKFSKEKKKHSYVLHADAIANFFQYVEVFILFSKIIHCTI